MVVPGRSQFSTRPRDEDPLGSERKRGGTHRSVGAHQLNRRGTGRPIRVIPCFPKQGSRFLEPYTFVHPVEIISRDPLNVHCTWGSPEPGHRSLTKRTGPGRALKRRFRFPDCGQLAQVLVCTLAFRGKASTTRTTSFVLSGWRPVFQATLFSAI